MYLTIIYPFIISVFLASAFTWLKFRSFKRLWSVEVWPAFLIIFLGTWASSLWIKPAGFIAEGFDWLATLVVGISLMIALTMLLPDSESQSNNGKSPTKSNGLKKLGIFFWILIILLSIPIILGYVS